jgi:hypothetical protein
VRSERIRDAVSAETPRGTSVLILSAAGELLIEWGGGDGRPRAWAWLAEPRFAAESFVPSIGYTGALSSWNRWGIRAATGTGWITTPENNALGPATPSRPLTVVGVSWAWPCGAAGMLPLTLFGYMQFHKSRRKRLVIMGLCAACGYDLRATPERCPECGNVPEKAKA